MTELKPQRRGRKIAMTQAEIDAFLASHKTCRVATISHDGPHATPLWFYWDGTYLWLYSITRAQRWADLMRDPRIGMIVAWKIQGLDIQNVIIRSALGPGLTVLSSWGTVANVVLPRPGGPSNRI